MLDLPADVGVNLLVEARERDRDDWLRREWVSILPWMQTGQLKLIQLDEYLDSRTGRNIDTRSNAEIIAELEKLHGRRLV